MAKRLVTGGTGMVGSMIEADLKIGRKDCDLSNWQEVSAFFEKHQPEEVIHCAAKTGGIWGNMNYKGDFFRDNILINTHFFFIISRYYRLYSFSFKLVRKKENDI